MSDPAPKIHTETISDLDGQLFSFRMIEVLGGDFRMGGDDKDAYDNEKPIHQVNVPDFWMGEFLVTQALWQAVLDENPAYFLGMDRPIESVSWHDITNNFFPSLNELCEQNYRLPTEAEWEYASRGGKFQSPYLYSGSNRLKDVAWYGENSHRETKAEKLKQPNALGLYDMCGNVYEWCEDHWHDNYKGAPKDGSAWIDRRSRQRVMRGGSWSSYPWYCRVSYRLHHPPWGDFNFVGFRLVMSSLQHSSRKKERRKPDKRTTSRSHAAE